MNMKTYHDSILVPVVKPWLDEVAAGKKDPFILEEDNDSGHGSDSGKNNIVHRFKRDNNLDHYFNIPGSPDLSVSENCWQAPKQHVRKVPHFDDKLPQT